MRSPVAASSEAMRAATKRPADAAAIKIDRQLLDGVRLRACLAALLEAVLDEGACRDRVHDALIRIVAYCDEATDATIAGGARADALEICGAAADGLAGTTAAPAADAPTKPTLAEAVSRCLPPQKDLQLVLRPVPPLFEKISEKQAHAVTKSVRREQREKAHAMEKSRSTRHVPVPTRRRPLRCLRFRRPRRRRDVVPVTACLRDSPVFVHTGEKENGHGGRDAFREAAAGPRRELVGEEARGAAARGVAPDGAREAALASGPRVGEDRRVREGGIIDLR